MHQLEKFYCGTTWLSSLNRVVIMTIKLLARTTLSKDKIQSKTAFTMLINDFKEFRHYKFEILFDKLYCLPVEVVGGL